ncbi:hypothetical protein BZA77DRAFT_310469 [Pyronema omphalodes]|nr:hypothetical protein BZA77DRAFT_310469 [Pyronema omphalodes]
MYMYSLQSAISEFFCGMFYIMSCHVLMTHPSSFFRLSSVLCHLSSVFASCMPSSSTSKSTPEGLSLLIFPSDAFTYDSSRNVAILQYCNVACMLTNFVIVTAFSWHFHRHFHGSKLSFHASMYAHDILPFINHTHTGT